MLVHISGAPIWWPENRVNIWNLLRLSRQVIICTEQTGIYLSTYPIALTSKKAQYHEKSIYIFQQTRSSPDVTHRHNSEIQIALVSKCSTLLSFKIANRYKFTTSYI